MHIFILPHKKSCKHITMLFTLQCKQKKTTKSIVVHAVVIDNPVRLELHTLSPTSRGMTTALLPMSLASLPLVSQTDVSLLPFFMRLTTELGTELRLLNIENRKKYIPLVMAVKIPVKKLKLVRFHRFS